MFVIDVPFEVAALLIALAFLLVYYAWHALFGQTITSFSVNLGPVGAWVQSGLDALATTVVGAITTAADVAVTPAAYLIATVPNAATQLVDKAIDCLTALFAATGNVASGVATTVTDVAATAIAAALAPLQSAIQTLTDLAIPALKDQIAAVADEATNRFVQDEATEVADVQRLDGTIAQNAVSEQQQVAGIEAGIPDQVAAAAQSIEAGVSDQIAAAAQSIENDLGQQIGNLQGRVGYIEGELAQDIPGLQAGVATAAAAAALAEAAAAAVATDLTNYLNECGDPLCDTFKPDIPNITGAFNLITDAALAAFLAYCITDPDQAADVTDALVTGPAGSTVNELASVVGGL